MAPRAGVSSRRDHLGAGAQPLTRGDREGNVLVDASTEDRSAGDPEVATFVRPGGQPAGRLDPKQRADHFVPTTNVVLVESAVLDERLVDLDGVDAEPRRPRGVVELDPDVRVWSRRSHAGRDMGPLAPAGERPEAHRRRPVPGPAEQPQGHMAPRAGVSSRRDHLGTSAEAVASADRQEDVLVDASAEDRGTGDAEVFAFVRPGGQLAGPLDPKLRVAPGPPTTFAGAVETAVVDKIGGEDAGIAGNGRERRLKPPGDRHAVVRLNDVVNDSERVLAVPAVHVLLEDADRAVAVGDLRGRDDRGVTLLPSCSHAQHITGSWHTRAVVGNSLQVAAIRTRVVGDHLRAIGGVRPHSVLEKQPPHRQFDTLPLVLSPGAWEEPDDLVVAATVRAWSARGEPVPARERKRPAIPVGVADPAPPRWKSNRRRISCTG